jgi:tetratricopeptide (TPR) repeat protein
MDLAVFISQEGDKDGAIWHLEEALRLDPGYGAVHYNLAEVLVEKGRYQEAIDHCRQALDIEPHHPTALNIWGIALVRGGDVEAGVEKYRESLAVRPGYADAHYNLAIALYGQGRHEDAVYHFEQCAELMRSGEKVARARLGMGMAMAAQGKAEAARSAFEAALALDPESVDLHLEYGSFLYGRQDLEGAMLHARRAIALAPDRAAGYNNLAAALAVQGRYDEAIGQYQAALRIDGENDLAKRGLAWTLAKQNEAGGGSAR